MKIGIDVGGTNTDAVLMEGDQVLAWAKRPTTRDVTGGILAVLQSMLVGVDREHIERVMIGTTHFINAFIQRRDLARVGILRIGAPAASSLPPLCDWPTTLRTAVDTVVRVVRGGHQLSGERLTRLDEEGIRAAAQEFLDYGAQSVALTSVFSSVNGEDEARAAQILSSLLPGIPITASRDVGRLGLLERENAAIINALVAPMARRVMAAFCEALEQLDIKAPLFISQNDGTMVGAEQAARHPILTFASGPTNSMRGAALLSGQQDSVIVDIGGTTADIGVLVRGYPRAASSIVKIAEVRTNFRMPDLLSIGLGGGSVVRCDAEGVRVGPDSLGFRLTSEGMAFGGPVLTATDLAIAAGGLAIGDPDRLKRISPITVREGMRVINLMLDEAIDRIKTSPQRAPITLVGGGAVLIQSALASGETVTPPHYTIANAVGAALSQVGGEVDRVMSYGPGREVVLAGALAEARQQVIAAGADPDAVETVEIDELPIANMPGNAVRVRVRVLGDFMAPSNRQPRPPEAAASDTSESAMP